MRAAAESGDNAPALADVDAAIAARDALDPQIDDARQRVEDLRAEAAWRRRGRRPRPRYRPAASVRVTAELEIYRRDGEHSYFRDPGQGAKYGRSESLERLDRHSCAIGTADGGIGEFVPRRGSSTSSSRWPAPGASPPTCSARRCCPPAPTPSACPS